MLVTGGAGFIGSHLSELLIALGDTVTALDDLSTGSERNLEALTLDGRLEVVGGSVLDRDLVDELVRAADSVVHLASPVGVKLIVDAPLRSLFTTSPGRVFPRRSSRCSRASIDQNHRSRSWRWGQPLGPSPP
jgi:UDP-glucose 4-epimerase